MKQRIAGLLAWMLLISPACANAATWGEIVGGLRGSTSYTSADGGTTAMRSQDGQTITVRGGVISDWVIISSQMIDDAGKTVDLGAGQYVFENIELEQDLDILANRKGESYRVVLDDGSYVNWTTAISSNMGSVEIVNNGMSRVAQMFAHDDGYTQLINNGTLGSLFSLHALDGATTILQNGKSGVINNFNGDPGIMSLMYGDGAVKVKNEGFVASGKLSAYDDGHNPPIDESVPYTTYVGFEVFDHTDIDRAVEDATAYVMQNYDYGYGEHGIVVEVSVFGEDIRNPAGRRQFIVTLVKRPVQEEVLSPERKRHLMEEKRKEEAVGGVTGSPYWVRQLYIGYMSLNLRLFVDGSQVNFKERIGWLEPGKTKFISLRVNQDDPQAMTMRLDEAALDKLEQAGIAQIILQRKDGQPLMTYAVSQLRAAYGQHGLIGGDLLVVGGMDDPVMKIDASGEMKSIEE